MINSRKLQILVVDDNKMIQATFRSQFSKIDMPVNLSFANDGDESVLICNEKAFDLIFMDYNMPKMNGEKATQLIRNGKLNQFDKCTIFTCSATTSYETGYQGIYPGANDRLDKPVKLDELRTVLEKFNQETLLSTRHTESTQDTMVETNLKQRTTKASRNSLFPTSTQSLDQRKGNDLEEEKSCCRKYCTIL